jgi:hypothetical protein
VAITIFLSYLIAVDSENTLEAHEQNFLFDSSFLFRLGCSVSNIVSIAIVYRYKHQRRPKGAPQPLNVLTATCDLEGIAVEAILAEREPRHKTKTWRIERLWPREVGGDDDHDYDNR